ncbi:MAG TPA: small multi-drug resistant family protein [Acetobacteraceae bacterium]|jgi:multidrug transporter EmrE-like cation transporter|nr:small multi-drug resistant family protein [Acetobacteraceae bacterium]
MTLPVLGLVLLSVSLSAVAQVLFKLGMSSEAVRAALAGGSPVRTALAVFLSPGVLGGLSLYGIGTVLWLGVLSRIEVSQAYPFVGLGFVLTALIGYALFGDTLGPTRIGGIALIMAGIFLISRR